jgi:hypothetical protein
MRKRRGHFCWCCGLMRPNERFSGGGHARHLCKDCHKLGAKELTYRQAVRNIDRMIQWESGRVKRKQRNSFAKFLRHADERVRRYAESVAAGDVRPYVTVEQGVPACMEADAAYADEDWIP